MDAALVERAHYALGPRIPVRNNENTMEVPTSTLGSGTPSRIWSRAAAATTSIDKCASGAEKNPDLCEKSGAGQNMTLPIALGVA